MLKRTRASYAPALKRGPRGAGAVLIAAVALKEFGAFFELA